MTTPVKREPSEKGLQFQELKEHLMIKIDWDFGTKEPS